MAQIINLNTYKPTKEDKFFVDTNVWYWFTYVPSKMYIVNKPQEYQTKVYPEFIEKALNAGSTLYHCPLILAELSSIIERAEWDYYKQVKQSTISLKQYRKIQVERKSVFTEVQQAWTTISSISTHMNTVLTQETATAVINSLPQNYLDTYDCFYTQLMRDNGIQNIISDDADFNSCDYSKVYTSNNKLV